jgi:hypothetical protein
MSRLSLKKRVELIKAIDEQYPLLSVNCDPVRVSPVWDIEDQTNGVYKGESSFRVEIPTDLVIENGLRACLISGAKNHTSGKRAIRCLTLLKIIDGDLPTKVLKITDLVEAGYMSL